jgi:hypothetical protein
MTDAYDEQRATAEEALAGATAFTVLARDEDGEVRYVYAVDEDHYDTGERVAAVRANLLGHHVRHLADLFGVTTEEVVSAALGVSTGFEDDADDPAPDPGDVPTDGHDADAEAGEGDGDDA